MIKRIKSLLVVLILVLLYSCTNNSEEDLAVDCSSSNLVADVSNFQKSACDAPGSIEVSASGGEAPYTYSINGIDFQESSTFSNLFAGNFNIVVQDALGCTSEKSFRLESEDAGIELSLSSTNSDCLSSTGSVTATASGGSGTLQFKLSDGSFSNQNTFSDLGPGDYTVEVKDEENCIVSKTIRVSTSASLTNDILPIINSSCAISGCHNGSVSPNLTSTGNVINNAARIKSETQQRSMPRGSTLPQSEIDLIACWVDDGAKEN